MVVILVGINGYMSPATQSVVVLDVLSAHSLYTLDTVFSSGRIDIQAPNIINPDWRSLILTLVICVYSHGITHCIFIFRNILLSHPF